MTKIKFSDENIHQSDLKNVEGVAYSGGPVRQYWSDFPIYVDLEGMEIQNQIPILFSHYNSPTSRLGEATIENNKKTLVFNGVIDTDGDELAQEIVRKGIKIDWQVSIGADVLAMEELRDGETIEVNGNNVTGPVTIVKKSLLREISVVAVGADSFERLFCRNRNCGHFSERKKGSGAGGERRKTCQEIIEDYTGTHAVFVDDTNRHCTGGLSRLGICGG